MTTIQVLSDIHLEMRPLKFNNIIIPSAKILALVGDIGSPFDKTFNEFIEWCSNNYEIVFFVAGNHEYYNTLGVDISTINNEINKICTNYSNVIFLYNKIYILNKYCFIGSTLWSYIPDEHATDLSCMINDYRYIFKEKNIQITVEDTNCEYIKNKKFIEENITYAIQQNLIPIILTHHTPSFVKTSAPQYEGGISKYAFSSKLECQPGVIRLWCCGHTHYNFHSNCEGYEMISNQYGYGKNGIKGYSKNNIIYLDNCESLAHNII